MCCAQQSHCTGLDRRQFLGRSAALAGAVALPAIVPSSALGRAGATAPSNHIVLGAIGHGIHGLGNMRTFRNYPNVKVVAVCDVHLLNCRNHHANFIDAILERAKPAAPIETAVRSDTLCNLQYLATLLRRKLRWDPEKEVFLNDDEANRLLDRPMRAPWSIG